MQVFTYWHDKKTMPPYVRLCVDIMQRTFKDIPFVFYDNEDVVAMLPDIRSDIWKLTHKKNLPGTNWATRSNYIRNKILYETGGFWLDADTLVLDDIAQLQKYFKDFDYIGRRQEAGYIAANFIGSRCKGKIISKYIARQDELLDKTDVIDPGSSFAARIITEIIAAEKESQFIIIEEDRICPINFKNWKNYFRKDLEIDQFINSNTICFQLFNRIFPEEFCNMAAQQILEEDWLISKLFRYALENNDLT